MPRPVALISGSPTPELDAILKEAPSEVEVRYLPQGEKLGDHMAGVEILFGAISEADFVQARSLRWIQVPFAGIESLMYPALKASDVLLTNSAGLFGPQIAEHAFALLLSLTRAIPTQLEFMKRKHWERVPC